MTLADTRLAGPGGERPAWRWTISLAIVLGVHGVAYLVVQRMPSVPPVAPPPAMVVDLAMPAPPPPLPAVVPPKAEPVPPPPPRVAAPDPVPIPPKSKPHPPHLKRQPPPKPTLPQPAVIRPPADIPPPPRPAPAAQAPAPQVAQNVVSRLLSQLEPYKHYPDEARRRGMQGVATIRIVLDRDGHLLSYALVKSSGHDVLDDEAVELAQRAAPYPPLPPEMTGQTASFTIPISFGLH